jgi:hypothetical protein
MEVSLAGGPTLLLGEPGSPSYPSSLRRVGLFGEVGVGYRSSFFLSPLLAIGFATLADGVTEMPSGPWGAGGPLAQHLSVAVLSPGVTADVWRFRLRYGLGLAAVVQRFGFQGNERSSTQLALANELGLGFLVADAGAFRLDAETRVVAASGADVTFVTLDLVTRLDAIRF